MTISRRDFLASTSAVALTMALPETGEAWTHGVAPILNSPVTVNFNGGFTGAFLNIAKFIQPFSALSGWPSLMNGTTGGVSEYPNGNFTTLATGNVPLDPTYYGHYIQSWVGAGSLFSGDSNPVLIYSQSPSSSVVGLTGSGEVGGNFSVSATSPTVEFAFGLLLKAVSTYATAGPNFGCIVFTSNTLNHAGNFVDGLTLKFNNLTGLPAGPNSDGSWTIFAIDFNNFGLVGSSGVSVGGITLNTSGTVGLNTEGIYSATQHGTELANTYSGFSNLIICRKNDLADITAGKLVTPEIVAAFAGTSASYLRFMDMIGVQNVAQPAYAQRVLPGDFSWGGEVNKIAYWGGVMSNSSDTFTCPTNPTASPASGAYVDGEIVLAQVPSGGHNTTANPRMGITGRTGTAPIYSQSMGLKNMFLTGTVPVAGTVLAFTFNGNGLSSFNYNYTVGAGESFQSITNNIRAALQANTTFTNAGWYCQNPSLTASSFGSWIDPYAAFFYNVNINSAGAYSLNVGVTITATDPTGAMTFTFGPVPFGGTTGYLVDGTICFFTYSAILGGWVGKPSIDTGPILAGGPPLEYYAELCARANSGMWLNIGVLDSAASITSKVTFFAQALYNGQPAVKTLALEWGNETWNSGEALWMPTQTIAACLGFNLTSSGGGDSSHGLRTQQMAQLAAAAWTAAGRSRSQLRNVNAYQFTAPNGQTSAPTCSTMQFRFQGGALNASSGGSNTTLKNIGGLGATSLSLDYSSVGNRPSDWCDWISPAPYWSGAQDGFNIGGGIWPGTVITDYDGLLLAAYNYAYGNSTQKTAALDFLYSISGNSGDLYTGIVDSVDVSSIRIGSWIVGGSNPFAAYYWGMSAVLSTLDATRSAGGGALATIGVGCYEGGWQMGPSSAGQITGTLTGLGYTNGHSSSISGAASGGPTGSSDTAALAAQNMFYLLYGNPPTGVAGWKNDARAAALVTQQFTQFRAAARFSNSNREAYAAWYGFTGPTNIWSLYPGLVTQSAPFQAYNAIAAWR